MNNILKVLDKVIEGMQKEIDRLRERNNELFNEVIELSNKKEDLKENAKP